MGHGATAPSHDHAAQARQKGFWDSGLGLTLIVLAICLACVPVYIGMDALGAFTFTGLLAIFGGFWAAVMISAWLIGWAQRRRAATAVQKNAGDDASTKI